MVTNENLKKGISSKDLKSILPLSLDIEAGKVHVGLDTNIE
nr:hypothetical protein [Crassaminicella thermophila]